MRSLLQESSWFSRFLELRLLKRKKHGGHEINSSGTESCPMTGFGTSGVRSSGFETAHPIFVTTFKTIHFVVKKLLSFPYEVSIYLSSVFDIRLQSVNI